MRYQLSPHRLPPFFRSAPEKKRCIIQQADPKPHRRHIPDAPRQPSHEPGHLVDDAQKQTVNEKKELPNEGQKKSGKARGQRCHHYEFQQGDNGKIGQKGAERHLMKVPRQKGEGRELRR